jgi:predicted nucleic acid-binding protein
MLAGKLNVSAYDAAYAAVAYAQGEPLWTLDNPLRNKLKLAAIKAKP